MESMSGQWIEVEEVVKRNVTTCSSVIVESDTPDRTSGKEGLGNAESSKINCDKFTKLPDLFQLPGDIKISQVYVTGRERNEC